MDIEVKTITDEQLNGLLLTEESHFVDFKSKAISPSKLTKTISAFANTSGGEIFVGIEEIKGVNGPEMVWAGFDNQESANAIFQVMEAITPLMNNHSALFLASSGFGLVLHLTIFKSQDIITASDGKIYVRRSAQNLPVVDSVGIDRLKFDKGIRSFEDETVNANRNEIENSVVIMTFLLSVLPTTEPDDWTEKQKVTINGKPTVAGVLLYSDNPQATLPKRSAIKILRYQTKHEAERDFLVADPITIEGPIYELIYSAVDQAKMIIESIEKHGPKGPERVSYPHEALHELLTNAVLHRDYSVVADVQVRIFDNRVEIESPGRLPGHVTTQNISKTQFARNPKVVRLINKFKNPPNKDVGEGINTAFEAMNKIRLKEPIIMESEGSVLVVLRHESLGSPEQMVMDYLKTHSEITNAIARDLTGERFEKRVGFA